MSAVVKDTQIPTQQPEGVTRPRPLFEPAIVRSALKGAVLKLDPRRMIKNPVMFVVEIGSAFTSVLFVHAAVTGHGEAPASFILAISVWLWFTVLFANFAEAMAEGRGKAQADTLRKSRKDVVATRLKSADRESPAEKVSSQDLRSGDFVRVDGHAQGDLDRVRDPGSGISHPDREWRGGLCGRS